MSSTRKIPGWVRPAGVEVNGPGYELGSGCGWCEFNERGQPDHGDEKATLIIGGKGYTQEEHEAEFQRRAKAMAREVLLLCNNLGAIDRYKARDVFEKYGIINP